MVKPIDIKCENHTCPLRYYCHTYNKKSDEVEQAHTLYQPTSDIDCEWFETEESELTIM